MRRRHLIATAASAVLAAPRIARADGPKVLKFKPLGDLGVLDPVWTSARPTRNHGYLVFDTLFGIDENFAVQPQMVEGFVVEDDGKRWTMTLREGLRFHDGEPVLARDVVPSVKRFCARDGFGRALLAVTDELIADGDRRIVFRLKKPFPHLALALAGSTGDMPCIMPARLAETDPFKQITEMVGSGPFKFVANERVAGHRVVYEKFAGYVPRPNGTSSFLAGPKVVHYDRVEWAIIPDAATAAAALQSGELDMWENVVPDFLPVLKADRNLRVGSNKMLTAIGFMRFNHLYPPFDNPEVRRALLLAVDQASAMQAVTGTDPALWSDKIGLFGPQMPLHTSVGTEVTATPRDYSKAKQALAAAGYKGEPIVLMDPADVPELHALNAVAIDVLRQVGLNLDVAALDFGTVIRRRTNAEPPDKGGWNVVCSFVDGAYAFIPPNVIPLSGTGKTGMYGWSTSPRIEALKNDWLDASDMPRQKQVVDDLQRQLWIDVPYIPMGQYQQQQGWRKTVTDIPIGFPLFYGLRPA